MFMVCYSLLFFVIWDIIYIQWKIYWKLTVESQSFNPQLMAGSELAARVFSDNLPPAAGVPQPLGCWDPTENSTMNFKGVVRLIHGRHVFERTSFAPSCDGHLRMAREPCFYTMRLPYASYTYMQRCATSKSGLWSPSCKMTLFLIYLIKIDEVSIWRAVVKMVKCQNWVSRLVNGRWTWVCIYICIYFLVLIAIFHVFSYEN